MAFELRPVIHAVPDCFNLSVRRSRPRRSQPLDRQRGQRRLRGVHQDASEETHGDTIEKSREIRTNIGCMFSAAWLEESGTPNGSSTILSWPRHVSIGNVGDMRRASRAKRSRYGGQSEGLEFVCTVANT
ncbi:MAG TPA: hypothetical protein VJS30_25695 [Paraburkholderia sp.]|nr:hypothetical protein [Paraburkholderia sp.]